MKALGKGTRNELMLARRAIKTAITHLGAARLGLHGEVDAEALEVIQALYRLRADVGLLVKSCIRRGVPTHEKRAERKAA